MKKETYNDRVFIQELSLTELVDSVDREIPLEKNKYNFNESCGEMGGGRRYHWHDGNWRGGLDTWEDARKLIEEGWAEGATKALALKEEIMAEAGALPKVRRRKRRQCWDAQGASLDVDRALAGQWDTCWRSTKTSLVEGSQRCVTLNIHWGGNAHRSADELFWSGAIMLVLSDILQEAGYNVQVNAVCPISLGYWKNDREIGLHKVVLKAHDEPMRPDALAAVVCHAGIFRSYGFRCICEMPWNVGTGLGQVVSWKAIEGDLAGLGDKLFEFFDSNDIMIEGAFDKKTALEQIKKVLKTWA